MKKDNYIMTTNKDTAQQLIDLGFELISKNGSQYKFRNRGDESLRFFDKNDLVTINALE